MLTVANGDSKTARITPDPLDKNMPVQNWSNPPEIKNSRQMTFKSTKIYEILRRKPHLATLK
jgi:hypothetical protein